MKRLKELNIISFPEQPIVNIEENDFSNISQYDYYDRRKKRNKLELSEFRI